MMRSPERPHEETHRLRALRGRTILDTPPEERFDRITRLAQRIFDVPIALVSLVDEKRQWFKSRQGLDICETSRDVSFCAHTILDENILEVNDASTDPRFADNPLVTGEPHIRFYAGAPLRTQDGYRVGTLCLIDTHPRKLSASQHLTLRELADCVQDEINLRQDRELATMLATSQARHVGILKALPDMVFVVDRDGRFIDCHDHPDLLIPREQVLQTSIPDALPAHVAEPSMTAIHSTLETGETVAFEYDLDIPAGPASFEARVRRINAEQALVIIRNITRQKQAETALYEQQRISAVIARAQASFITEPEQCKAFDSLLDDVLDLTRSEFGFLGEILQTPEGAPYLKTYAITNIAWNADTRAFYEANAPEGLEFTNLKTLFGAVLTSGEAVIANAPAEDPRRGGLPDGHPQLNAFLGLPVHHGSEMVAMLGIANRPGGYDQTLIEFLHPLLMTLGQLIFAARIKHRFEDNQAELARLSRVASQTTNGVVITDTEGRVEWVNEGFTRITGHTLADIQGRRPGEVLQGPQTDSEAVAEIRAALARGEGFEADLVNYTRDHKPYWIRIQCNPLRDGNGTLQGFMAIESEVTQEIEDAERMRASERRLASVIEGTHIGTWEWNVQTGETVFNERWAEIVGYSLDELAPINIQTWMDLAHPEDLELSGNLLERHFSGDLDFYDCTARMRHKDGHWVWVHDRGRVVSWTADGKPLLMSGTHADVTAQKQAEQALRDSERQFRSLVNNIPGITYRCLLDEHWTMLYMSDQVDPLSGYPASDFIENAVRSYVSVIHPEDRPTTEQTVHEALHCGTDRWTIEYRIMHRDGSIRWAQEQGSVVRGNDGRPRYLDGFILDVTEAKQASEALQASEMRLRGLFELSPIGIALNDYLTGEFVDLNEALLRPTGYTREEFTALSYWDVTPREYEPQEMQQLESMERTGRYGPYEKEYIRNDGSRYPVLLNGMVVYDQTGRKLIWSIIEDISERKRIERMKNEFISTVSHELRTPLTAISGALGLVVGGAVGTLPAKMQEMLEIAHKNSQRLGILINDLLDMEKLVAGKMRFDMQVQALQPLLEQAIQDNQAYADQFGVRLRLSHGAEGARVKVDAQRLQQVLTNLLSNAAKFSPEGGEVVVSAATDENHVRVSIMDRGPGIPEEFRERIFQKFSQADASDTRSKGGSGLGLAITRELVERMGGVVGFDSVPGEGATFWFSLPTVIRQHAQSTHV
jgi:PAS domain S-box-containing protein